MQNALAREKLMDRKWGGKGERKTEDYSSRSYLTFKTVFFLYT